MMMFTGVSHNKLDDSEPNKQISKKVWVTVSCSKTVWMENFGSCACAQALKNSILKLHCLQLTSFNKWMSF